MAEIIPDGYTRQSCEGTSATFLKPNGWYFWPNISSITGVVSGVCMAPTYIPLGKEALYETGMHIGTEISLSNSPFGSVDGARHIVDNLPPEIRPASDMHVVEHGSLTTFYRAFTSEETPSLAVHTGPRSYYIAGLGDTEKEVAYIATFETPTSQWETYQAVGKVLIEGIRAA